MQNAPLTESNLKKELIVGITFHRNFMSYETMSARYIARYTAQL